MKTPLILAMLTMMISAISSAQNPVKTSFRQNDDMQLSGLLGLLDACQITATIHYDDNDARYYELWLVEQHNGKTTRHILGFAPVMPDSTSICVTTMAADSATVNVYVTPSNTRRLACSIPTGNALLIECHNEKGYEYGDTIPLMAYSTGHMKKYDLGNGNMVDSFDICGVRYSGLHPSQWQSKFNITNSLYIEAVPVKEMDFKKFKFRGV